MANSRIVSDQEKQLMASGLLRPISKILAESTVHPIASLALRPDATVFGKGSCLIVDPTKPGYRIKCTSDNVSWDSHGSSDSITDRPSAAALGKGSWQVGRDLYLSDGSNYAEFKGGIGAVSRPYVAAQTAIPMMIPPSSSIGANGALQLGTKVGGGTATFGATSGAGVSCTLSLAGFAGTAADVGKVVTVDGGKQATITAAVSTTVATVTITGTLSGTGPFTDWTLSYQFLATYSGVYLYFIAGAVYSGSVAGWYYTVMSSTTVGTVYDNIYTAGTLSIPASPTGIVSAAIGEFTQTTLAVSGLNFPHTGGMLGINGRAEVFNDAINSPGAGTKTSFLYFDDTQLHFLSATTNVINPHKIIIQNRGKQNSQKVTKSTLTSEAASTTASALQYPDIDTAVNGTWKIVLKINAANDFVGSEAATFDVFPL